MARKPEPSDPKIGVYVCHCGLNIAATVDVEAVVAHAAGLPGVAVAREYRFMCSDPGQELIKKDLHEGLVERVVVASCSPLLHENTFRGAVAHGGRNPYLFQMANIREHCSWVEHDKARATEKAKRLVAAAVLRLRQHEPLEKKRVSVRPEVVVLGAGIAGISAALGLADAGRKVYLVEREASIGGHMSQFDKTFPTLDCAACILTPRMVSVGQHPNIELMTYSEVESVEGHVGDFKVRIRHKRRRVDVKACNACGDCMARCPALRVPRRRVIKLGKKTVRRFDE